MSAPDQTATRRGVPAPDPNRWRAFVVCLVAGFMTLLDVSIVNVALPSMQSGLGASSAELSWVVSGYALTFGLVLVASGRLGDDRGRRRMFLIALAFFTLTSAVAGLSVDPTMLVVARFLQGAAGGMMNPQIIGLIQDLFSGRERGRAFGFFGAAIGVSTAVGPLTGGLLLQWAGDAEGWRWVFEVNVPIGIVALALGARWLPEDRKVARGERRPLDVVGAALLGAAVVALMLPLVLSEGDPGGAPWWLLAVCVVLLAAFVGWERRARRVHGHPLIDFALLRTRSYALGTGLGLLYFAGFTSIFFVLTLFLQQGEGFTPLEAGLALTPFALGSAVTSALGGRMVSGLGKALVVGGLVAVVVGLVATDLVLRADPAHLGWAIAGPLLVAGVGSGFVIAPNQTLALEEIPPAQGGTAAGVLQTGQRVGSALGISAVGAVFFAALAADRDWSRSISNGLLVTTGLVVLALVVGIADLVTARTARRAAAATAEGPDDDAVRPDDDGVRPDDDAVRPDDDVVPGPGIAGRVVRSDDGAAVARAVLTLLDGGGHQAARTDADDHGAYRLRAAAPGSYQLVVRADGYAPDAERVTLGEHPGALDVVLRSGARPTAVD